jgi:hypothetical protein
MTRMDFSGRGPLIAASGEKPYVYAVQSGFAPEDSLRQRRIPQSPPTISHLTIFIHRREYICTRDG